MLFVKEIIESRVLNRIQEAFFLVRLSLRVENNIILLF